MFALATACLFVLSALCLGYPFISRGANSATTAVSAIAAGLLIWSGMVAGLGALGLLYGWIFALILALSLLPLARVRPLLAEAAREMKLGLGTSTGWLLAVWFGVVVCDFAPNSHFDVAVYHYAYPEMYLRHHSLAWLGLNSHEGLIGPLHMLYIPMLALGGESAANLLGSLFLFLLLVTCIQCCDSLRPGSGVRVAWLLLTSPLILFQALGGLSDLPCACFASLALAALLGKPERISQWVWIAIWSGAALAIKWTAISNFLCLSLVAAACLPGGRKRYALIMVLGLLLLLPQLGRNYLQTGDPLYPLIRDWSFGKTGGLNLTGKSPALGLEMDRRQRFPFNLVPLSVDRQSWQDACNPFIWIGLLFALAGIPVNLRPLAGACALSLLLLCLAGPADLRYCLPSICWWACLAASLAPTHRAFLGLCCLPGLAVWLGLVLRVPMWAGETARIQYLEQRTPYSAYRYLEERGRPGETVYLLGRLGYRCPLDYVCGDDRVGEAPRRIDYYIADLREPYLVPALLARLAREQQGRTVPLESLRVGPLAVLTTQELRSHLIRLGYACRGEQVYWKEPLQPRRGFKPEGALQARPIFAQDGVVLLRP